MNAPRQPRLDPPPMRRSTKIALVLLGTAGAVGIGAAAIDAWRRAREDDEWAAAPRPSAPPISTAQSYANNAFLPGVGYYHAPYHAWFPYPFNYHDPARGYFAGGLWQAAPFVAGLLASQPSNEAVTAALAARRAQEQREQQQRQAQSSTSSGSHFRSSGGSWFSSSRPSSSPSSGSSSGSHSIQRGGFGSSGHSSGGSS